MKNFVAYSLARLGVDHIDIYRPAPLDPKVPGNYVFAGKSQVGYALALGHARSGDAIAIDAYLGTGSKFDEAMVKFAVAYADQNERDHQALKQAIATNQVQAISDV